MSRTLTGAVETAVTAEVVRPVLFVALALDDGALRLNSADRDLTMGGYVYYGVGTLGSVSHLTESAELQATGLQMTLTGIPARLVTVVLAEHYQGRGVSVWQGFVSDSYALIADPLLHFLGVIDQMSLAVGESATITLTAENSLVRWETPKSRRYTDAEQQARHPGDLGCQFVGQVVEKNIVWGRKV